MARTATAAPDAAGAPEPLSLASQLQDRGRIFRNTPPGPLEQGRARWQPGGGVMQGFLGVYVLETVERSGGDYPTVDGSDENLAHLPVFGGGGQLKLIGDRVDLGLEAMMSFGWRANATAIAAGGGAAVIAVDVSLFLADFYGGPFVSLFLGERWRVYGAIGPMVQWASYDQDDGDPAHDESGSGFGTGWYTRAGLEFSVRRGLMAGAGVRWVDSTVDLDSGLGDLDVEGLQWVFTVTSGI